MEIIHISAECFPVAKAGGLGDVVGALPKYQNKLGHTAKVVMPMYRTPFLYNNAFDVVHKARLIYDNVDCEYTIIKEQTNKLGFDLYLVEILGVLDREKPYGYDDDSYRFLLFQVATVDWINSWNHNPDIIHCHDHHSGLVAFLMQNCFKYKNKLSHIKTIFTIHNGNYQGWMSWEMQKYLPNWDTWSWGKLDWDDMINPLACGVRCAHKVTTVSQGYLDELKTNANGLEKLFEIEQGKCTGIVNGIDFEVWNPKTDTYIFDNYSAEDVMHGKGLNKKRICDEYNLNINYPLFVFIGRLVGEKAADTLPLAISSCINQYQGRANFFILGSGEKKLENEFLQLQNLYHINVRTVIAYNETLAHLLYAGADFLLMPSRVEPCGLNQLYALRYGTIPLVRNTGGLKDTIKDMGEYQGFGITFNNATSEDVLSGIMRAMALYYEKYEHIKLFREQIMNINHSWEQSAQKYIDVYKN